MNFEAKNFEPKKHYELMRVWYLLRKLPVPELENLAPVGCWVESKGKPICCGFLFTNGTKACVIANIISDPRADKQERSNAVDFLLINLQQGAKYSKHTSVLCSTNGGPAYKHFEKLGFVKVEENVTIYRREI